MRVLIPTAGCDLGRSGIGRFLQEMLAHLAEVAPWMHVTLAGTRKELAAFTKGSMSDEIIIDSRWEPPLANVVWQQLGLPLAVARRRFDAALLPAANRRAPLWLPCPTVGVVHDLAALRVPGKYDKVHEAYLRHVLPIALRQLSRLVTVSESSRSDIASLARVPAEQITVIPNGVDLRRMRPMPRSAAVLSLAPHIPVDRPYLLYVARVEHPGKNHLRLVDAFSRLKATTALPHRLVLAGPQRERADEVRAYARASAAADAIVFTGYLPDHALAALYSAADALIHPSLYEGFGIPLIEAMACATPVACANTSSLPEIAGEAALFFDPLDPEDMCATMIRLIRDEDLRERLIRAGRTRVRRFSWRESAARLAALLEDAVTRRAAAGQETVTATRNPSTPCRSFANPALPEPLRRHPRPQRP